MTTWLPEIAPNGVDADLSPYAFEVFFQCRAAAVAWSRAIATFTAKTPGATFQETLDKIFIALADLQAFLSAVGILSDLFFPGERGSAPRGERLRAAYGVDPSSPLHFANMKVRNSVIHVDERLDRWLQRQAGQKVGPFSIEPWSGDAPAPEDARHLRILDNSNWRLLVFGEVLELVPLLKEVQRIGERVPLEVTDPTGGSPKFRMEFGPAGTSPTH